MPEAVRQKLGWDTRIVVKVRKDVKLRWLRALYDSGARTNQELVVLLLDLYDAAARLVGERDLKTLVSILNEHKTRSF